MNYEIFIVILHTSLNTYKIESFQPKNFFIPPFCKHCGETIFGVFDNKGSAHRCTNCKMIVHQV